MKPIQISTVSKTNEEPRFDGILVQETVEKPKELVQESVEQHIHDVIVEARPNPVDEPLREPTKEFQPAQGEVFDIFPTPMFRGYLDINHEEVTNDVRRLVSQVKERNGDDTNSNYTTYFDNDIRVSMHQLSWYTTFANKLKDTYIQFVHSEFGRRVNHLSRKDIHLFTWMNRYEGEHSHDVHNHVNSTMSGTYYPLVNEQSVPIKFMNPNSLQAFSNVESKEPIDDENGMKIVGSVDMHISPNLGEFLMWPSYMMHSVSKSGQPNYERISISFNLSHNELLDDVEQGDQLSYGFMHE